MKIKHLVFISCLFAGFFFASCKSTPEAEPESTEADSSADSAENSESTEASVAETNANLLDKAEKAREAAVAAEAQKYYPELFSETDKYYVEVKNNVAAHPDTDWSASIKDVTEKWESLEKAALAQAMKEKIDALDIDMSQIDHAAVEKGQKALEQYKNLGSSASGADLLAQANEAYAAYKLLLDKGYSALAARERKAAVEAKKNADSVKAAVAKKTKDDYAKAADTFIKADASYSRANCAAAYDGYKSSKETFISLYETVKKDREEAQAALEKAKQRVAQSASYSEEADAIAPLTEKVAGIEDENAVLLEEETFANPDDAIIDVESSDTAKTVEKAAEAAIAVEDALKAEGAAK